MLYDELRHRKKEDDRDPEGKAIPAFPRPAVFSRTGFTGFKVNPVEYKVMELAPYGDPRSVQAIVDDAIDENEVGSFKMSMEYFEYSAGLRMTGTCCVQRMNSRRS